MRSGVSGGDGSGNDSGGVMDPWSGDPRVQAYLGSAFGKVREFRDLLVAQGVRRGLIGPREVDRLWERHLLNSAAVAPLLPAGTVIDVGSGAGLPGIVLAVMRPDVHLVLVESMQRRALWLEEMVKTLGLETEVVRARAEDLHGSRLVDGVTARAVARLDQLAAWSLPLVKRGGVLLALKGDRASEELAEARDELRRLGGDEGEVVDVGTVEGVAPTHVVRVHVVSSGARSGQGAVSGTRRRKPRGRR
ncbi:16S rRNA (guanine(527)-N(7))-methyltransferase RsmG [Isoptericola sp. b490]|uniref:16S rRNA (guanine(527)-N(7))-methyltransferase RsmG n=1 Tax=Actinotalea lenta TaxID=3064654 RepID=UPI0027125361|nr:16S rRNA (guanine(527)-N(7))-methyltransferase RsmG [Isoptericola sp. b490]MDO8122098.1 16S rRNA (guanine(527)-N(7))-methyltransferase RsmG [Isoptericola sp. b490]